MSAPPCAPVQRKTFGKYARGNELGELLANEVYEGEDPDSQELLDRLRFTVRDGRIVADDIDRLAKLQTWARERWPSWYTRRSVDQFGKNTGPTGKQIMDEAWADYLFWSERES